VGNGKIKTIAVFINTSWNIYNFRLQLLKALRDEGFRVVSIAPRDNYSDRIGEAGFEHHEIDINNMGTNPLEDLQLTRRIYALYRKIKPDVALHYTIKPNIYGTVAARMAGVRVISTITGLGTVFLNDKFSSRFSHHLYRFALRFADKVVFQNQDDLHHFISKRLVNEKKAIKLPGSGIDAVRYDPGPNSEAGREGRFVFLLVARMLKDKGVVEFIEAAQMLLKKWRMGSMDMGREFEFWLLGDIYPGNPTALSMEQINLWCQDPAISYHGFTDDVIPVMKKSDCIVLPSYREGLSRVLLEAASLARPIITTNVPGCRDLVDDGVNGLLCEARNAVCLADQMEKMLLLPSAKRAEMGRLSRNKILESYSDRLVNQRYIEMITGILN
jgi:glycosyltransferase involved in cell wall biosynthesis